MFRALVTLALAAMALGTCAHAAEDPFPGIAAAYLVQVQGRTLWANAADKRLPLASLTKIMTALLVLERGELDSVTTISASAAAATGARLRLMAGSRMKVTDLLVATLVRSANDACVALAEWHSGSAAKFVETMNARARALDLQNTHFENACGFDADGQYSSASDLARLTEVALADERFRKIVALRRATLRSADGRRTYRIETTNALLDRLPGAEGVKSGYTDKAGRCVVALAQRDGRRVLLVMLDATDRWWDAHELIERAFAAARR